MNAVNVPLLRKAVEWAEAEAAKPDDQCEWFQGYWAIPVNEEDPNVKDGWKAPNFVVDRRENLSKECGTCYCIAGYVVASMEGSVAMSSAAGDATSLLGLTWQQADQLFDGGNSIGRIRTLAEKFAGERL